MSGKMVEQPVCPGKWWNNQYVRENGGTTSMSGKMVEQPVCPGKWWNNQYVRENGGTTSMSGKMVEQPVCPGKWSQIRDLKSFETIANNQSSYHGIFAGI